METNPEFAYCAGRSCAAEIGRGLQALAGRWSVPIVEALHFAGEPLGFAELKRRIPGISPKELARHLGALVDARVVRRASTGGARYRYDLTEHGHALLQPMQLLGEWAQRMQPREAGAPASWIDPLLGAG